MTDFAGFWSYAHVDNKNTGGRILSLSERLQEAFELQSAEPLTLFVDRDIQWGDEWERRISQALQQTTFFIPIVTPSYFRHPECRKELLQFAGAAKQFGLEQLILPIYYVSVPEIDADGPPNDEAMAIVKSRQWVDFRDVRVTAETDSAHLALVDKLAGRLLEIAADIENQPPLHPSSADKAAEYGGEGRSGRDGGEGQPVEAEEGYLDLLARGEAALPEWTETITAIGSEIARVGELTEESASEMQAEDAAGSASFANRLAAANRFASRLEAPAKGLSDLGGRYVAQLFEVDPAVKTMIRFAQEDEEVRSAEEVQELFRAILQMTHVSRESMDVASGLANVIDTNSGFSRELRKPLKKIEAALRNIVDAQSILDEWANSIEPLLDQEPGSD